MRGPSGRKRLRLEVDVGEAEVAAREGGRRVAPGRRHGLELLVEDRAALVERHAERLVLLLVPAHGRLHDQAALAQQVERRELLGEQQRMPQRRDHGGQRDAQPRRRRGDGGRQHDRVGPRRGRILVAGRRVVARVAHDARRRPRRGRARRARSASPRRPRPPPPRRRCGRATGGHAVMSASSSRSGRGSAGAVAPAPQASRFVITCLMRV